MKLFYRSAFSIVLLICWSLTVNSQTIYVNQVGLDSKGAKTAVVGMDEKITTPIAFKLIDVVSKKSVFEGKLGKPEQVKGWDANKYYYQVDFSNYHLKGKYTININVKSKQIISFPFQIAEDALATLTIPSIIHYYNKQRANTPQELAADKHIILQGSTNTVDLTGGWCDA
ncbi:MAG: glycosyl transferase, partial [Pedobacter sp.]